MIPLASPALSIGTAKSPHGAAQGANVCPAAHAFKAQSSMETFVITVLNVSQGVAINRKSIVAFFRLVHSSVFLTVSAVLNAAPTGFVALRTSAMAAKPLAIAVRWMQSARVWCAQKICQMAQI